MYPLCRQLVCILKVLFSKRKESHMNAFFPEYILSWVQNKDNQTYPHSSVVSTSQWKMFTYSGPWKKVFLRYVFRRTFAWGTKQAKWFLIISKLYLSSSLLFSVLTVSAFTDQTGASSECSSQMGIAMDSHTKHRRQENSAFRENKNVSKKKCTPYYIRKPAVKK